MPSNPRRPSRGQEFDVAHAMRTFLKQMASDVFRSAPRSLRSSSRTPMMPEPPNWFHLVDHCNRDPRRRQGTGNGDFKAAGRFDNHQVSGLKSPSQLADSGRVVGNCKALAVWPNSHVQLRIGPVDPDKPFCIRRHRTSSRCCPALQSGISFPSNRSGLITVKARRSSLIERVLAPLYGNGCRRTIDRGGAASRCLVALALLTAGGALECRTAGLAGLVER
jgi:hypothetical protein